MKLRFKSSGIFVFLWVLLIKDVCHALDLQLYPDGITAIDANIKCGTSGIENNPFVLTKTSKLHGKEFWTGLGIYTELTAWIDILGCFQLSMKPSTVYAASSPGLCQQECLTRYFGYNKETTTCSCLNKNEIQLANGANLSSCERKTDKTVLVYETYNGTIQTSSVENGLCTTLVCSIQRAVVLDASCEGNDNIKSLCEDGKQSTSNKLWGLTQNQTSENCRNKHKLLLHTNACQYLSQDLTVRAWTNVFREEIEVEQKLGERTAIPKFCLSAIISDKGEHVFDIRRHNCSTKLEWFACKNVSTTVDDTYHIDAATDSKNGAVIGGVLGACSMVALLAVLIVCKVRLNRIFAKSNTHHYEDTSHVNISTTTYEDLNKTKHRNATATSNRTCDIDKSIAPVYDEVNESAKQ